MFTNPGQILVGVVTLLYLLAAICYVVKGQFWMGWVFLFYAGANVGLIMLGETK